LSLMKAWPQAHFNAFGARRVSVIQAGTTSRARALAPRASSAKTRAEDAK
jgi:hypothetical protein